MKKTFYLLSLILLSALAGCIKNDIPYPRIQANIVYFAVQGEDKGPTIDSVNRTVTIYLPEEVDIENVIVDSVGLSEGAKLVGDPFSTPVDFSEPVRVAVQLYQSWQWTITASQTIERYFTVAGQVGSSIIDAPGHRVVAYVAKNAALNSILVETAKLGPTGSTITPELAGKRHDFTKPLTVTVSEYGREVRWTIFVENTDVDVATVAADAWTNVAWIYGRGEQGKDNGIEYRLAGDQQWIRVPQDQLVVNGGDFHARLTHLSPLTTYEARAYSGEAFGETLAFTTGTAVQVPNHNLDEWWLDGKVWNPWPEGGEQYWDTGNKGATTLGSSNSFPTEETSSGSGWAAQLETRFVGIAGIGKLAAGNIFVGSYVRTDGTNGVLSFGRPFEQRPTKLKGFLKYNSTEINYANTEMASLKGQPDTCIVWCALIDSDEPFEVRTNPKNRHLFDPEGDYVVAYGKFQSGQSIPNYIPFEFELNYKSTSRKPKYIIITASASKYGDYFTGGAGSVLWIDDLELLYDY